MEMIMVLGMILSAAIGCRLAKRIASETLKELDGGVGLLICCSLGAAVAMLVFSVVLLLNPRIGRVVCLGIISLEVFCFSACAGKEKEDLHEGTGIQIVLGRSHNRNFAKKDAKQNNPKFIGSGSGRGAGGILLGRKWRSVPSLLAGL